MTAVFLRGLESAFAWMLEASWQASVLAALVLLLQWTLRDKLNPRWRHALWLLVIARLLLPVLPESALSLFQFAPPPPPAVAQTITEPIFSAPPLPVTMTETTPAPPPAYPFSTFTILALVWLTGAIGFFLVTWLVNRRFARHVLTAPTVNNPRLLQLIEAARHELGVRRTLRTIESAQIQSPAIMGLLRPTLILPTELRARFTDAELRFIFLHEFAHLKRGDLLLQWLIALLQVVHWFNPVLWYAFRRMRIDREPATDALVLSRTGEAQKESYGQVLVKLLEHYHNRHALPTLVGILEDKDQFKQRFLLITKFTRGAYGWSLLGVLILVTLAAVGLTRADTAKTKPAEIGSTTNEEKTFNALLDDIQIGHLDVHHMPLDQFIDLLVKQIKANDSQHRDGLSIVLRHPDSEPWITVDYEGAYPDRLNYFLYLMKRIYPINYRVRENDVELWQLAKSEVAFTEKAKTTRIDLDLENVNVSTALKAVQDASAARGFTFPISRLDSLQKLDALQPDPVTLHAKQIDVDSALRTICYLGTILGRPREDTVGFDVSREDPAAAQNSTKLRTGIEIVSSDASDIAGRAQLKANIEQNLARVHQLSGPSVTGPAYPWVYRGKTYYPGTFVGMLATGKQPVGYSASGKTTMIDKAHIQIDLTITLEDKNGKALGKVTGQWTQPPGNIAHLLQGDQPVVVTLPDGTRKALFIVVEAQLVDEDDNPLLPLSGELQDVPVALAGQAAMPIVAPNTKATADTASVIPPAQQKLPWPVPSTVNPIGFLLADSGEISRSTDPAINDTIDRLTIHQLDAVNMPLQDFMNLIAKQLKQEHPEQPLWSTELMSPDTPYLVTFHLQQPASARQILQQLSVSYPLRFLFRGAPNDLVVWQIGDFERAFGQKATATTIQLDLGPTDVKTALQAIEKAAAAQGFEFKIGGIEKIGDNFGTTVNAPVILPHGLITVDQALRRVLTTGKLRLIGEQGRIESAPLQDGFPMKDADFAEKSTEAPSSATIQGTVLDPDGKPASGAKIGVGGTLPLNVVLIKHEDINPGLAPCAADGKFSVTGVAGSKTIFAMDATGYALVPMEAFKGTITLKPWARVEGRAVIGSTPAHGSQVVFHSYPPSYISGSGVDISSAANADEHGAFVIDRVPEGVAASLMFYPAPLVDLSTGKPTYDPQKPPLPLECQHIQTVSGQTTQTVLGGPGVTVTDKLPVLPTVRFIHLTELWSHSSVHDPALPAWIQTDQEKQQFMHELQTSDLAKKDVLGSTGYYFYIQHDGSFRVENIPPGTYSLSIDAERMPRNKLIDISFDVPAGVTNYEIPASAFKDANQSPPATTSVTPSISLPKPDEGNDAAVNAGNFTLNPISWTSNVQTGPGTTKLTSVPPAGAGQSAPGSAPVLVGDAQNGINLIGYVDTAYTARFPGAADSAFVTPTFSRTVSPAVSTAPPVNPAQTQTEGVAAIVDGFVIKGADVLEVSAATEKLVRQRLAGAELDQHIDMVRQTVLHALIDRHLMLEFFKKNGGSIPASSLDNRMADEIKQRFGGNRQVFLQTLAEKGETLDSYRQQLADNAAIQYLHAINVSDKVWNYYQAHLDLFPADEQLNVTLVTIPFQSDKPGDRDRARQEAERTLAKIQSGADIDSIAKSSPQPFGHQNPVWRTKAGEGGLDLYPNVWQGIQNLQAGEVSGLIEGGSWFFAIAKVNQRREPKVPVTDQIAQQKVQLLEAEGKRLSREWMDPIRAQARITYYPPFHAVDVSLETSPATPASVLKNTNQSPPATTSTMPSSPGLAPDPALDFPWKENITATSFWIERPGFDSSPAAADTSPSNGAPTINPYFVALPFNDLKYPELAKKWLPAAWQTKSGPVTTITPQGRKITFTEWENGRSKCEGRWVEIKDAQGHECYAQWEDVGPILENDAPYVFGTEKPAAYLHAALDVSPAVSQILKFSGNTVVSWRFVDVPPPGPWLNFQKLQQQKLLTPMPDEHGATTSTSSSSLNAAPQKSTTSSISRNGLFSADIEADTSAPGMPEKWVLRDTKTNEVMASGHTPRNPQLEVEPIKTDPVRIEWNYTPFSECFFVLTVKRTDRMDGLLVAVEPTDNKGHFSAKATDLDWGSESKMISCEFIGDEELKVIREVSGKRAPFYLTVDANGVVQGSPIQPDMAKVKLRHMLKVIQTGDAPQLQQMIDEGINCRELEANFKYPPRLLEETLNPEVAEILIRNGIDPNAQGKDGATILGLLVQESFRDNTDVVRVVLAHGANPNARMEKSGITPVMLAHTGKLIDLLVENGADAKLRTIDGQNAFHFSAGHDVSGLEALARHGVPFDAKRDGPELMAQALAYDNAPVVQWLLGHGVDPQRDQHSAANVSNPPL